MPPSIFESLGIAKTRLIMERRSRNTAENAVFSKALVAPKAGERWLLVTSAYHMPRSVGLFRKAGFAVEPYPVDWRVGGRDDLFSFHDRRGRWARANRYRRARMDGPCRLSAHRQTTSCFRGRSETTNGERNRRDQSG